MNELLVALIFIFLPGIIATLLIEHLLDYAPTPRWNMFRYGLYALVLGVLSYLLEQVVFYFYSGQNLKVWNFFLAPIPINVNFLEILWAIVIAIILGFIVTRVVNSKLPITLAKLMRVTNKYGDESLFLYYLGHPQILYIYVRDFERNLTYFGRLLSFNDNGSIQELVLSDVKLYRYEDSEELYSVPTIYICRPSGSVVIEEAI